MRPEPWEPLSVCALVVTFASTVGCILMLVEYFRRPVLRSRIMLRPIFYEAASCIVWAAGVASFHVPLVMGTKPLGKANPTMCIVTGAVNQFAAVAAFGWYTCIAYNSLHLFMAPVKRLAFTSLERRRERLRLQERLVWGVALMAVLPPLCKKGTTYGPIREKSCSKHEDVYERTKEYECWIRDDDTWPSFLGEISNFLAFLVALSSGLVLLIVVFRNRRRLAQFSGVMSQTVRFVSYFSISWALQHIYDFQSLVWTMQSDDDDDDDDDLCDDDDEEKRGGFEAFLMGCNVCLKGVAGLVVFLAWYWSRALSGEADEKGAGTAGDPQSHSMDEYMRLSGEPSNATDAFPGSPEEGGGGSGSGEDEEDGGGERRMGYPADERDDKDAAAQEEARSS